MSVFQPYSGPQLQFIDASFYLQTLSGNPIVNFDANDFFQFLRVSNQLFLYINSVINYSCTQTQFQFTAIPILPSYTVATLPSAAANPRGIIYVSDGTTNKRQAVSDGTNWRWPDGAIVS
jgi:hypothetical protein